MASACVLAALAVLPVPGSDAQTTGSASVSSEGWWNATPTVFEELPATPLGALPVPSTPAPDVPEGSVPVAMRGGEPSRVGAIGITVDAPAGSQVGRFVLTLKEAPNPGAQQGTGAAVRACPITSFLVPETNGPANEMPEADCEVASADGQRAEDGTWTFDLAPIASVWLDEAGTVQPNGVRLDPVGEPPASFQVAFTGVEDAVLDVDITPGAPSADPFATTGSLSSGGAGGSFDTSTFDTGGVDVASPSATVPTSGGTTGSEAEQAPAGRTLPVAASGRVGDTLGNWGPTVVLLAAAAVLLALAMGLNLGPMGRQRPDLGRRQGGVSRALARRLT